MVFDTSSMSTLLELKGVSLDVLLTGVMAVASTAPSQFSQAAQRSERTYYLCSMTTQMVSQTERLMGIHAVYCGEADNDSEAQVVKCTPVIVLHQADEITLFRWHPTGPCSTGALGR